MTHDDILYGRLKLLQPKTGPRVNMDTVLLAAYVRLPSRKRASFIELGTATGAVSLMLALRFPERIHILGIEIQPELEKLAQRNRIDNGLEDRTSFCLMDLREHRSLRAGGVDGLVVNPPYDKRESGRGSPCRSLSIARQDSCCSLEDVVVAAAFLLKNKGRFFSVLRADRMSEFLALLAAAGIEPKRLRLVYPAHGKRANLFLLEGVKGGGNGLTVEPPLFVYGEDGEYTSDLLQAYRLEGLPCL